MAELTIDASEITAAPGRPLTRAMPSPTSTMRPICSVPTAGVYSSTWRSSACVISLASIVSSAITVLPLCLLSNCPGQPGGMAPNPPA